MRRGPSAPYAHYGDCLWPDTAKAAKPHSWSSQEALRILRRYLGDPPRVPDGVESDVLKWVRRDLPELRSAADRATPEEIYRRVAQTMQGETMFASGRPGALQLGYGDLLDAAAPWSIDRFVGIGCPWSVHLPSPGDRVLDIGCGAGVDLSIADEVVGDTGLVVGVDRLAVLAGAAAVKALGHKVVLGRADALPLPDGWATFVTANGLPPLLGMRSAVAVLTEVGRVLAVEGHVQFTSIVVGSDRPIGELSDAEVLDAIRCSKPMCAQYRALLSSLGFGSIVVTDCPSPFASTYRAGAVRSVVVSASKR